jgi:Tol biopolymer transport system component
VRRVACLTAATIVAAGLAAPARGVRIEERTLRVSTLAGADSGGVSVRPSLSPAGTAVAFESTASTLTEDPNGAVKDVFTRALPDGAVTLISRAPDGAGADGPSESPVMAGEGVVVFASQAANLVPGDTNGVADIFVHRPGLPLERVSVAQDGAQSNGASFEADVSRDGRRVVFASRATNLVPGDDNGVEDVFLRDLGGGSTRRLSERAGADAQGRSRAPAISQDGTFASFHSTAANLVRGDRNKVADVFLADLAGGTLRRVSVDSREREQNRAVQPPFVIVSDVSDGGRFVAFDSDASNLVARDRLDTDVFVRDVRRGRTELASIGVTGKQGDNDSYFPTISNDGRYVAFTSFARNLFPSDPRGEDLYVLDRASHMSTPLTVTVSGFPRPQESAAQLLRRVSLSDGARAAAFASTAALVGADTDGAQDVYVRRADPPDGRIVRGPRGVVRTRRPRLRLDADEPRARFVCRLDGRSFLCPRDGRLPALSRGRHRLVVRATGPGMLPDPDPPVRTFRVR